MKHRLLKITLLTIVTAAMAGLAPALHADDSTNAPAAAADNKPQKFYGTVSAVDTNAMTFTVEDQTFTLTGESQATRNGNPATISDVVVGDPARGSYTQGADGKLDVTKVRFGKKPGGKSGSKKSKSKHSDSGTTDTNAPSATSGGQ